MLNLIQHLASTSLRKFVAYGLVPVGTPTRGNTTRFHAGTDLCKQVLAQLPQLQGVKGGFHAQKCPSDPRFFHYISYTFRCVGSVRPSV